MSKSAIRVALLAVCCFPLFSLTAGINRSWTGAVSNTFSEPNNWSPAGIPAPDDSLTIQVGSFTSLVNDLPAGTSFGPITFGGFMALTGNAMTLTGDVASPGGSALTCDVDLKIAAPLTLTSGGVLASFKSIDVNGQTLTIAGSNNTTVKSLNGNGTVVLSGAISVSQDGTFNGTIVGGGVNIGGSMPGANVTYPPGSQYERLSGSGTLGSVRATFVYPGWQPEATYSDPGVIGTLKTKSLSIDGFGGFAGVPTGAFFDLDAAGASDQIQVTGTVTLNNTPELHVTLRAGAPAPNQTFTLIDNDGTDPVAGTFFNLPEGATLNVGGYTFILSYHGGDGNDVVLTTTVPLKTWNGSVNTLWSNPANWTPNAIPVSGEPLIFPAGATMMNDLPAGTQVGQLRFNGSATLNGNALTLMGDVAIDHFSTLTCNADLKIGAPLKMEGGVSNSYGSIDVNGKTLSMTTFGTSLKSLDGSGMVEVLDGGAMNVSQGGTFNGTIVGGGVNIGASMSNANMVLQAGTPYVRVSGDGTLGNVAATFLYPGWTPTSGDNGNVGTLKTKSLLLQGLVVPGIAIGAFFDLNAAAASDQVQVTGTVTLADNPMLIVAVRSGTPVFGQHFVIIDNDGTDPVSGTFAGLPDGAAVNVDGTVFRLTYSGGDGNDVELIVAATTSAAISQGADSSVFGEPVALSAAITSGLGTPAGTVTFLDNGVAIGSAPLSNGNATLNVSTLSVGSHTVTAVYSGGGAFFGATSGPITHTVAKGGTATTITVLHPPAMFGAVDLRISSTPIAPAAGTVSGTFTLREGTTVIGSGTIDGGGARISLPILPVGTHTLVASYSGSANFLGSNSAPFVLEVNEAPTVVSATLQDHGPTTDGTVALEIFVLPTTSAPLIVTGTITISESGVVLTEQPTTGVLDVTLKLAAGHHVLSIAYSGDANFLSSSKDLELEVVTSPPAKKRSARH